MEQAEKKLNKQISKYYVDHACQIASPGVVAKELGLDPSRISELRGGRRQLTVAQAEILKAIYGLPSASQGYWMECELVSTKNLHKQFIDNGLALHFIQLIGMISTDEFTDYLAQQISIDERRVPDYEYPISITDSSKRAGVEQKNKRLVKSFKLNCLNKLLAEPTFQEWCNAAYKAIKNYRELKDHDFYLSVLRSKDITTIPSENIGLFDSYAKGKSELEEIFKSIDKDFRYDGFGPEKPAQTLELLILLHQLNHLVAAGTYSNVLAAQKPLNLNKPLKINQANSPLKDYVVVAKVVWEVEGRPMKLTQPIATESVIGWHSDEKYQPLLTAITPPVLNHATFTLFYTEQYQYFVEVSLYQDELGCVLGRRLLIEIEDRQAIFDELIHIFSYFKVDCEFMLKNIKQAVALKGGYIPGAIYID